MHFYRRRTVACTVGGCTDIVRNVPTLYVYYHTRNDIMNQPKIISVRTVYTMWAIYVLKVELRAFNDAVDFSAIKINILYRIGGVNLIRHDLFLWCSLMDKVHSTFKLKLLN